MPFHDGHSLFLFQNNTHSLQATNNLNFVVIRLTNCRCIVCKFAYDSREIFNCFLPQILIEFLRKEISNICKKLKKNCLTVHCQTRQWEFPLDTECELDAFGVRLRAAIVSQDRRWGNFPPRSIRCSALEHTAYEYIVIYRSNNRYI